MTARTGRDPGEIYRALTREFGEPCYDRVEAAATPAEKALLAALSPGRVKAADLAGERIEAILTRAPGNNAPFGGLKAVTAGGWFAARPSGTEEIYKIYAESFLGEAHLRRIVKEAQAIVGSALAAAPEAGPGPAAAPTRGAGRSGGLATRGGPERMPFTD
jgi:phosphoglucomutase